MEHSQSEGITLLRFMEMFLEDLRSTSREPIDWSCTGVTAERMHWKLTSTLEQAIVIAKEKLQKYVTFHCVTIYQTFTQLLSGA